MKLKDIWGESKRARPSALAAKAKARDLLRDAAKLPEDELLRRLKAARDELRALGFEPPQELKERILALRVRRLERYVEVLAEAMKALADKEDAEMRLISELRSGLHSPTIKALLQAGMFGRALLVVLCRLLGITLPIPLNLNSREGGS